LILNCWVLPAAQYCLCVSESTEKSVIHLPGKVKNGVAMELCSLPISPEYTFGDDELKLATCRSCLEAEQVARYARERWYRDQEDY
jgi:hypothetical protein